MSTSGNANAWARLMAPQADAELFQFSIIDALLERVYEGDMTFAALAEHGDFGLGTFNGLDGEMVAVDGVFHQLHSDGGATVVGPDQKTPFASVTRFRPELELHIAAPTSQAELERAILAGSAENLFTAIRVQGCFASVQTRTVGRQTRPFPPLSEVAAREQIRTLQHVEGTLSGFRTPAFAESIGVSGFHLHFLTEDKKAGGHVLSYSLDQGTAQLMNIRKLHLELPVGKEYLAAHLDDPSAPEEIRAAEGGHHL